jgi:hypothetical protein
MDPQQVWLGDRVVDRHGRVRLEGMAGRERDAEALAIERLRLQPLVEAAWGGHDGEIELAVEQQVGEPARHAFDQGQLDAGIGLPEHAQEAHEARGPDRAHDAQVDRRVLKLEEAARGQLGRLGIRHHPLQMRPDQPSEIGDVGEVALAPKQKAAELRFEPLDRPGQRRRCHMALIRGTAEIERVADGQEIADLVHFHGGAG